MIHFALKAGIPVIAVHTTDTLNARRVLEHLVGNQVHPWGGDGGKVLPNRVYFYLGDVKSAHYEILRDVGSSLVIINPEDVPLDAFDAGQLVTPPALVAEYLSEIVDNPQPVLGAVRGLTLKQVDEVIRITSAAHGQITPRSVQRTRAKVVGQVPGLSEIGAPDLYLPPPELEAWAKINEQFFKQPGNPKLVPRGLLLDGDPGVGKTQGAKWLCKQWDIPLYHVNVGGALNKYHGVSEGNFDRILTAADNEAPCGLLFDEIEKLFGAHGDEGTTQRILSRLLYWMQEHESRVLTLMTTNAMEALPPELYRPGRIDQVMVIEPLNLIVAKQLAFMILQSFKLHGDTKLCNSVYAGIKAALGKATKRITHADVTQIVYDAVKESNPLKEQ